MFELLDEWRNRGTHRHRAGERFDPAVHGPPAPGDEQALPGAVEPFSECESCGGPRFLRTEPVAAGTGRLTLVCDGCGLRTEI